VQRSCSAACWFRRCVRTNQCHELCGTHPLRLNTVHDVSLWTAGIQHTWGVPGRHYGRSCKPTDWRQLTPGHGPADLSSTVVVVVVIIIAAVRPRRGDRCTTHGRGTRPRRTVSLRAVLWALRRRLWYACWLHFLTNIIIFVAIMKLRYNFKIWRKSRRK